MKSSNGLVGELIDASRDDPQRAALLLRQHPDLIDARYIHGETPLHFCAIEYAPESVKVFAALGFDVNAVNDFGDTALIDAATIGNIGMVALLLELGADPNAISPGRGCALHVAIQDGNLELARMLIKAGANPFVKPTATFVLEDILPRPKEQREAVLKVLGIPDYGKGTEPNPCCPSEEAG